MGHERPYTPERPGVDLGCPPASNTSLVSASRRSAGPDATSTPSVAGGTPGGPCSTSNADDRAGRGR